MDKLNKAIDFLKKQGIEKPDAGIVLGTGLNGLIEYVRIRKTIAYAEIPGFPPSTVDFHKGQLVYGELGTKRVVVMQGRWHSYEGYSMQEIAFPVRVMKLLGIRALYLSNAAGGIHPDFKKGDLVLIHDHINLLGANPLTGKNLDELGPRFPDMSAPYDERLMKLCEEKAGALNIKMRRGVYAAVGGPNLETRAEYRFLKIIGADMVGMSTVPEVILARFLGLKVAAISTITNMAAGMSDEKISHEHTKAMAPLGAAKLERILREFLRSRN